jgi:hypothetical protein
MGDSTPEAWQVAIEEITAMTNAGTETTAQIYDLTAMSLQPDQLGMRFPLRRCAI